MLLRIASAIVATVLSVVATAPGFSSVTAAELTSSGRLERVRRSGSGWEARCPAHEDQRASLSIGEGQDGRILLTCHAGCSLDAILLALDLKKEDLFPPGTKNRTSSSSSRERITFRYDYRDEHGTVLYQVERTDRKNFWQRHPCKEGHGKWNRSGWTSGLGGKPERCPCPSARRVLYRLPELLAADAALPVWIPEGEKDVETLVRLGLVATCNAGGADNGKGSKWRPKFSAWLRDRSVILLEDNDDAGRTHVDYVASTLQGVARSVKVIRFPDLPKHGDVSDWIAQGHTREELETLTSKAEPPPKKDEPSERTRKPSPADLGEEFLETHHALGLHGTVYVYADGAYRLTGERIVRRWAQHRLGSQSRKNDGDELCYWLGIHCAVDPAQLDAAGRFINVKNGLLDWRTGELSPHTPDVYSTVQVPAAWTKDAYHERGDRFLTEILPDADTRALVERYVGYCLCHDCHHQRALLCTGDGSNGKSVLLSWITSVLGAENVSSVKLQDLEHRFRAADLVGKLANISADIPRSAVEDSGPFKILVTGDEIQAERKFRDPFKFANRAKLIFSANELPATKDRSGAYFRRWIVVPFPRHFGPDEPGFDPNLLSQLVTPEGNAYLLRLAVSGLWLLDEEGGFTDTEATAAARDQYRRDADSIAGWYDDECCYEPESWTAKDEAYRAYRKWCEAGGHVAASDAILARRLIALEPRLHAERSRAGQARTHVWRGLSVSPAIRSASGTGGSYSARAAS